MILAEQTEVREMVERLRLHADSLGRAYTEWEGERGFCMFLREAAALLERLIPKGELNEQTS